MEEQILRCNNRLANGSLCREPLKDIAIVTTCSHVLCPKCAAATGFTGSNTNKRQCPVCTQPLSNIDDAAETNLRPTEEYKMSVLCGFDPTTIMECASSALSFWNYQMLQETAYQQHLVLALSKKYNSLNGDVNKIVDDANTEIEKLHTKIEEMTDQNSRIQQRNAELTDMCRDRGKKYNELRKGYESLKRMVQQDQQNHNSLRSAEQAVKTFTTTPIVDSFGGVPENIPINHDSVPTTTTAHPLYSGNDRNGIEQLHRHQRAGSGSQYSGDASRMPPPPHRSLNGNVYSPIVGHSQHRTPLTSVLRQSAERPQYLQSANRSGPTSGLMQPGSGQRHSLRVSGSQTANHSRQKATSHHSGISTGMKVGGANVESFSMQNSYIPARSYGHRSNDIGNTSGQYY